MKRVVGALLHVAIVVVAPDAPAAEDARAVVVVQPLETGEGISVQTGRTVTRLLIAELGARADVLVVDGSEPGRQRGAKNVRAACGLKSDDDGKAEQVVGGTLGARGSNGYLLSLTRVTCPGGATRWATGRVLRGAPAKVAGKHIPDLVRELFSAKSLVQQAADDIDPKHEAARRYDEQSVRVTKGGRAFLGTGEGHPLDGRALYEHIGRSDLASVAGKRADLRMLSRAGGVLGLVTGGGAAFVSLVLAAGGGFAAGVNVGAYLLAWRGGFTRFTPFGSVLFGVTAGVATGLVLFAAGALVSGTLGGGGAALLGYSFRPSEEPLDPAARAQAIDGYNARLRRGLGLD